MASSNRLEIPVGIKLEDVRSSLEELRRLVNTSVKVDTRDWKKLNTVFNQMEGTLSRLEIQSKGTFTSSTQIEQFRRKINDMNAELASASERLGQLDLRSLNIDTSKLEQAKHELELMQEHLEELSSGRIGASLDGSKIKELAEQVGITFTNNLTFDGLTQKFDEAAIHMGERVDELQQKLLNLRVEGKGLQKFNRGNFQKELNQSWAQNSSSKTALADKDSVRRFLNDLTTQTFGLRNSEFTANASVNKATNEAELEAAVRQSIIDSAQKGINDLEVLYRSNGELSPAQQDKYSRLINARDMAKDTTNGNAIQAAIANGDFGGFKTNSAINFAKIAKDMQNYMKSLGIEMSKEELAFKNGEGKQDYFDRIAQIIADRLRESAEKIGAAEAEQAQAKQLGRDLANSKGDIQQAQNKRQEEIKNVAGSVSKQQQAVSAEQINIAKQATAAEEQHRAAIDNVSDALGVAGRQADDAADDFGKLAKQQQLVNSAAQSVKAFLGFNQVINLTRRAVSNALKSIRELDKVMTEIAVVTNMTQDQLWEQIGTYTDMARQYGVETKGVYEISMLFYQQGTRRIFDFFTEL